MTTPPVFIGTAGWTIPRAVADSFPRDGSGLERYAAVFNAVEVNSTFYRPHRASTYARWATLTPDHFRFAVKAARTITHDARLVNGGDALLHFISQLDALRSKVGVLLIQLPPSLAFEPAVAEAFFAVVRRREPNLPIACEPRHASWFSPAVDKLLARFRIGRAAADPARHCLAGSPGGWGGLAYFRLHGSPRMYYSAYGEAYVRSLAHQLELSPAKATWCVFDNTTLGAAAADALALSRFVFQRR